MNRTFEDDWPHIEEVNGWLFKQEAETLYDLASRCKYDILEIGSWKGRSTVALGLGSRSNKNKPRILSVDPFTGSREHQESGLEINTFPEYIANIKKNGLTDIVTPMKMTSAEAITQYKGRIGLLFIDGSHEYEDVKFDFLNWRKFTRRGDYIAIHDSNWPGPKQVIKENVFSNKYIIKGPINSMIVLKVR